MASLRRSTAMPNDGTMSKFLYTIMKQLDHKSIDWNLVASELAITNGHAARMRFSRFRQHMDGVIPGSRKPRKEGSNRKKANLENKRKKREETEDEDRFDTGIKRESEGLGSSGSPSETGHEQLSIKAEDQIKQEPRIKKETAGYDELECFPMAQVMSANVPCGTSPMDEFKSGGYVGELLQPSDDSGVPRMMQCFGLKREPDIKTEFEDVMLM